MYQLALCQVEGGDQSTMAILPLQQDIALTFLLSALADTVFAQQ